MRPWRVLLQDGVFLVAVVSLESVAFAGSFRADGMAAACTHCVKVVLSALSPTSKGTYLVILCHLAP